MSVPGDCLGCAWFSLSLSWPGNPYGCCLALGAKMSVAELLSLQAACLKREHFAVLSCCMAS